MKRAHFWICSTCLRAQNLRPLWLKGSSFHPRALSTSPQLAAGPHNTAQDGEETKPEAKTKEPGALSRRLAEMAEETMDTGSRSDRKLMRDVGFSDELKKQLEERIAQSEFKSENQQAISVANLRTSAGKGTRDNAAAAPWTGEESMQDSALRMLDDSHPRLRLPARSSRVPSKPNLKPPPKAKVPVGQRLADARDKTSAYALAQQMNLTEEEREQMRKDLRDRFLPGARPMPATLEGLSALANEKIEDAIARGLFKNIPRGKGKNVERDYNANSPFLDTTEYFMNKIIQKQDIVPPWIEKQQELVKTASSFRARLRNDWKRHAARLISSKGGSLEDQIRRAQAFALAEEKANPQQDKVVRLSQIDSQGNLATVTVEEKPPAASSTKPETIITVTETLASEAPHPATTSTSSSANTTSPETPSSPSTPSPSSTGSVQPYPYPFRDPAWERAENAYHTLAIAELNSMARSYNLMAPKIAQKPYYSLQRELSRCFADVAPMLADEIANRSRTPTVRVNVVGTRGSDGVFGGVNDSHIAKIRDEDAKKGYGFKEFWKDLFRKEEGVKT